ncbi:MAG: formate dehydrogenase accessory protein FdhE [Pseudodesulfovibrio sp.]|uniref:Formate dehydrogenase accessory protein n=1 Tax=Pseudodesulfovibrio aespoeensis (strain ATCC 700646 / DSM 10631 / Aspo-2) TaxID=643562 RepID=E6VV40_PSEA9|nr:MULTISPECIES: formate dehydrogenase accessory protein FdhE [Pseudodesulfovibrio]MBU4191459.1 formate dehydrogenase accessory protein FdhE [Pseudomonadota bacterium]ADU61191.1 formate dehydrogenase accessory protein [Pseudodesulfovibrio aespoeensis Aspo-2]MBU4245274.1 formate dehydrogenase accessory protein FdhE [Pseudomonadota bacterium]MBU4379395.1 formate dehydrogenase accessory protein FdhE [Pseudomonadota bacterium]MBU4476642.1 formate dehydrogenase accessory protein FdhE [Pseudomonadot
MQFNKDKAGRTLDTKISQLRGKSYISAELVDLLDKVAHLQLEARATAKVVLPPDAELAPAQAVLQGVPLVARECFPYDPAQAADLLGQLIGLLEAAGGPLGQAAKTVGKALTSGEMTPEELFRRYLSEDITFFASWVERTPGAPKALPFLALASLGPSIEAAAEQLVGKLPPTKTPQVGSCPICGSLPLISLLKEKEGFRHASCSFCRHDYRIRRIACPVCGEEDQKKLTFFTVDEEPGFRVDVCESCKTYIKTIDFRALDRIPLPVFDDLDSLALDYVAAGQGYRRATLSAWGF